MSFGPTTTGEKMKTSVELESQLPKHLPEALAVVVDGGSEAELPKQKLQLPLVITLSGAAFLNVRNPTQF